MDYRVIQSQAFRHWLNTLRDKRAVARIAVRIDRLAEGNFGDYRSVGGGVSELRVDVGPGYRLYYTVRGRSLVILLCGGDKAGQRRDIRQAQRMAREI